MRTRNAARPGSAAPLAAVWPFLVAAAPAVAAQDPGVAAERARSSGTGELVAQAPELVTDRPDITESTSIVAPGWMQVESGASLAGEGGGTETLTLPGTLLRVGVARRVELRLAWDGIESVDAEPPDLPPAAGAARDLDASGAADAEASVKVLLVRRSGARPDLALLPALTLPVGDDAFSSGTFDPGVKALVGNDVSERIAWAANAGVAWPTVERGDATSRARLLSWSISWGLGLADRLSAFLEYFGEDQEQGPEAHAVDGGLTFLASPHVQLDASGGLGLSGDAPDWFAGAGLAFRFGF